MHQISISGGAPSSQRSPDPFAGFKGPSSKGRAGNGRGKEGKGEEERGGRRGTGKGRRGRGKGIIVLEDCQLRTLDPPLGSLHIVVHFRDTTVACSCRHNVMFDAMVLVGV